MECFECGAPMRWRSTGRSAFEFCDVGIVADATQGAERRDHDVICRIREQARNRRAGPFVTDASE
jgi:hypothetical protein